MESGYDRLAAAIERGDVAAVRVVLRDGADLAGTDGWGMGPLECALQAGHVEVMRVLLEAEADPDVRSELVKGSLLAAAVWAGREDAMRLLVEFGARRDALDPELHHLVCSGAQPPLLAVVLELGAAVNGRDTDGWTPLHWAAAHGYATSARRLLAAGADPSATTPAGLTAAVRVPEMPSALVAAIFGPMRRMRRCRSASAVADRHPSLRNDDSSCCFDWPTSASPTRSPCCDCCR